MSGVLRQVAKVTAAASAAAVVASEDAESEAMGPPPPYMDDWHVVQRHDNGDDVQRTVYGGESSLIGQVCHGIPNNELLKNTGVSKSKFVEVAAELYNNLSSNERLIREISARLREPDSVVGSERSSSPGMESDALLEAAMQELEDDISEADQVDKTTEPDDADWLVSLWKWLGEQVGHSVDDVRRLAGSVGQVVTRWLGVAPERHDGADNEGVAEKRLAPSTMDSVAGMVVMVVIVGLIATALPRGATCLRTAFS